MHLYLPELVCCNFLLLFYSLELSMFHCSCKCTGEWKLHLWLWAVHSLVCKSCFCSRFQFQWRLVQSVWWTWGRLSPLSICTAEHSADFSFHILVILILKPSFWGWGTQWVIVPVWYFGTTRGAYHNTAVWLFWFCCCNNQFVSFSVCLGDPPTTLVHHPLIHYNASASIHKLTWDPSCIPCFSL